MPQSRPDERARFTRRQWVRMRTSKNQFHICRYPDRTGGIPHGQIREL
jgi:hypothetical protein